jgi:hypothetical protein
MIEFKPHQFYIAFWFVDQPKPELWDTVPNMNWIACLSRLSDRRIQLVHRFAYWDRKDKPLEKEWYKMVMDPPASSLVLIEPLDELARTIARENGGSFWERVDLNDFGSACIDKITSRSWARVRTVHPSSMN